MQPNKSFFSLLALMLVGSALPADAYVAGDEVVIIEDTPASFYDKFVRTLKKGETIKIAKHDLSKRKVFFLTTDAEGRQIALNVSDLSIGQKMSESERAAHKSTPPLTTNSHFKIGSMKTDAEISLLRIGGHHDKADAIEANQKKEMKEITSSDPSSNYKAAIFQLVGNANRATSIEFTNQIGILNVHYEGRIFRWDLEFIVREDARSFVKITVTDDDSKRWNSLSGVFELMSPDDMLSFTNHLKKFLDWDKLSQEQNLTAQFKPLGVFGSYNLRFSHSKDSSSSSMDIEDEKHGFVVTSLEVRIIAIMLSRYEQLREDSRLAAQAAAKEKARATNLLK